MDMPTDPICGDAHDDAHDTLKARRLINNAVELLFDALDRKNPGTDPGIVHMPRHLVKTLTFILHEARDNVPLVVHAD